MAVTLATADYTLTINVTPVNGPPISSNNTVTTPEDVTYIFSAADFTVSYSDPEGNAFAEIRITSLESVGNLLYNGNPVTLNQVINAADIGSNLLTFVPMAGQSASPYDSFDFEVGDGSDFSVADYTLTINVTPVNGPPTSSNNTVPTPEDVTYIFSAADFTVSYSDPEGDAFAEIRITSLESVGNLLYNGNPVTLNEVINAADIGSNLLTFVPVTNQSGSPYDSFDFEVGDGGDFSVADYTLTINVNPVNDTPQAINDNDNTTQNIAIIIDVLNNDNLGDMPTSITTVDAITAQNGSATINNNGTPADPSDDFIDYAPAIGFGGTDTFTYTITDNDGETSSAIVTIIVNAPGNNAPTALDDNYNTDQDTPLSVAAPGVLGNDSDPDGDGLTVISFDANSANGGTVVVNADGSFSYTPPAGFNGADSFTYTVSDGNGGTDSGTVTIGVIAPGNNVPTALDDNYNTDQDTPLSVAAPGVLGNDSDPDGDGLTVISFDANSANGGTVVVNADGSFSYTPPAGFNGADSFTYTVSDGNGGTDSGTVTIGVIAPGNNVPTALDDNYNTDQDTPLSVAAPGVLGNDSDPDGDGLTVISFDANSANGGTVVVNADGSFSYTPPAGFNGADSFTYTVSDGNGGTDSGTVTIGVIAPGNNVPTALDDNYNTDQDTPLSVAAPGVLGNDSDPDGDGLTVISFDANSANGGTVVVNADGSFSYTPPAGFNGADSFTYTVSDGNGGTDSGTVTIGVIAPGNNVPTALDDNYNTDQDTPLSVAAPGVLGNDSDPDGDGLTIISFDANSANGGTVVVNADGSFSYTPPAGFNGADSFTYTVSDGNGGTDSGTAVITVLPQGLSLIIYKGISPNGDGYNDKWDIDGITNYPDNQVRVYNRWGNLVYESEGYDNTSQVWWGQSNQGMVFGQKELPDGTYFYIVDLGDGSEPRSGYVMLKR